MRQTANATVVVLSPTQDCEIFISLLVTKQSAEFRYSTRAVPQEFGLNGERSVLTLDSQFLCLLCYVLNTA